MPVSSSRSSVALALFGLCLALLSLLAGCRLEAQPLPTRVAVVVATATPRPASPLPTASEAALPPTWTPGPTTAPEQPSLPTREPPPAPTVTLALTFASQIPTRTPSPSPIPPTPSEPTPSPSPTATLQPAPVGANLLPNPSFEGGWYHINGVPELQVPDGWRLEWEEGPNSLDPDPWNAFVRPESRVLDTEFLPAGEHDLFIWDGDQTVKIFKGQGAIQFRLLADVYLEPGTYQLEIHVFPDLVDGYTASGQKIWAPDPLSGEVRLLTGVESTPWLLPQFGRKNTFQRTFTVFAPGVVRVGLGVRGRWAIVNNGWFMDDWSLRRLDG